MPALHHDQKTPCVAALIPGCQILPWTRFCRRHPDREACSAACGAVGAFPEAIIANAQELDVAAHSVALITATASLLRLCCRALLHDRGGAALANGSEPYENMLFLSRPVEALVNDLVAALYPPQETEEIAELSAALHTSCECIVSEFPVSTALPDITEALRTAQLQLDEAHAALAAAL